MKKNEPPQGHLLLLVFSNILWTGRRGLPFKEHGRTPHGKTRLSKFFAAGRGSRPNIKLDLGRRWTNAGGMKWKAAWLLPPTLEALTQDRLNNQLSIIC